MSQLTQTWPREDETRLAALIRKGLQVPGFEELGCVYLQVMATPETHHCGCALGAGVLGTNDDPDVAYHNYLAVRAKEPRPPVDDGPLLESLHQLLGGIHKDLIEAVNTIHSTKKVSVFHNSNPSGLTASEIATRLEDSSFLDEYNRQMDAYHRRRED